MLLRRITQHVKKQNWFAIFIDFIIVVIGVAVAMMGQKWLADRHQRTEFLQASQALQRDLNRIYANAKERVAVSPCRIQSYQAVSQKLLEPGDEWIGMPRPKEQETKSFLKAMPDLLRSPSRNWSSNTWKAELSRGTFNLMDINRRNQIDGIINQADHSTQLQRNIYSLQGQMKTLALSTRIGQFERLKYLDRLGELDIKSALLEHISSQIITNIEEVGIITPLNIAENLSENLFNFNKRTQSVYGDCADPITMDYFENQSK